MEYIYILYGWVSISYSVKKMHAQCVRASFLYKCSPDTYPNVCQVALMNPQDTDCIFHKFVSTSRNIWCC